MSVSNAWGQSHSASDSTQFGSNVWENQRPYLQDTYAQAQQMAGIGQQDLAQQAMGQNALYQGQQMMGQSGQYAGGMVGQVGAANQMYGQSAQGFGQMAQGAGNNPQLDAYAQQVGQQFNRQIMPALQGQAQVAGQLGSSRAQIGEAMAAGDAQQNIQNYSQQLYSDEQNRRLQAFQGMQGAGAGMLQGAQMLGGAGQLQQSAAGGLMDASQGWGQWGQYAQQSPWANLQQYQNIIGGPAMRDMGGQSTSRARSWNQSGSFGLG